MTQEAAQSTTTIALAAATDKPLTLALPELGYVDPELAPMLAALPANPFGIDGYGAVEAREQLAQVPQPALPTGNGVSYRDIGRGEGEPGPALRIITPDEPRPDRPCIFWIHGGGFVVGSPFDADLRLFRWATEHDCVVVAVQYRLAPEYPYPQGLEDCYAGLIWTTHNAQQLGIDPLKIAIVGESAGGGLAAGLVMLARDRNEVKPCFQQLIYPMLDDRTVQHENRTDAPIWTKAANAAGWSAYLSPMKAGAKNLPIPAAPARAQPADLHGLPPCSITVGSLDLFRDEDIRYALSLQNAGIPTELHIYAGTFHGSDHLVPDAAVSRRFERDLDTALGRAFSSAKFASHGI